MLTDECASLLISNILNKNAGLAQEDNHIYQERKYKFVGCLLALKYILGNSIEKDILDNLNPRKNLIDKNLNKMKEELQILIDSS